MVGLAMTLSKKLLLMDIPIIIQGGPGNDKLAVYYAENKKLHGGIGEDIFILDYVTNGARKFDNDLMSNLRDQNSDGTVSWDEVDSVHPLLIVDFEQGTDKIGLRDGSGDWNGKTIIAIQGTGSLSSHTLLFMGKSERGADTDGYVWAVLWNTTATDITADDFVLIDGSYNSSSLSGVTISNDASLASDATHNLIDDSAGQEDDDNSMIGNGLIDNSPSFSFENITSSGVVSEGSDFLTCYLSFVSDDNIQVVAIEELEEEEILVSIDII